MEGASNVDIAERIAAWRAKKGFSQNQLAQKAKLAQQTLSAVESGKKNPTVATLEKICTALKVSLVEFFSEDFSSNEVRPLAKDVQSITLEQLFITISNLPPAKRRLVETFVDYVEQLDEETSQ